MASEQFSLCWDNFHKNMSSGMQSLLETEDLVDVTLAVEGRYLKAHKMVLSVCSPYFRELFQSNPCKHPIVFMKDVSYIALSDLLQFMYQGEVQVAQENLSTFIKTAEALQIKGLTGDGNNQNEVESTDSTEVEKVIETTKRTHEVISSKPTTLVARVRKPAGPASKRPRFTMPPVEATASVSPISCSTPAAVSTTKAEASSASSAPVSEDMFKMEPSETGDQSHVEATDENQGDTYVDEATVDDIQDDTEDYSLMDAGEDEPKAGTSADGLGDSQEYSGIRKYSGFQHVTHIYVEPEGPEPKKCKICKGCYIELLKVMNIKEAIKKACVIGYCATCPNLQGFCLKCFVSYHDELYYPDSASPSTPFVAMSD